MPLSNFVTFELVILYLIEFYCLSLLNYGYDLFVKIQVHFCQLKLHFVRKY
jgi:hypothetical protein